MVVYLFIDKEIKLYILKNSSLFPVKGFKWFSFSSPFRSGSLTGILSLSLPSGFFSSLTIVFIVTCGFLWSSTVSMRCSNSFVISGTVAKLSWVLVVLGVLCSGSGSVAGALCNCSWSNGLVVHSVGSSPMRLLVRCPGISSSDNGNSESSNSSYIPKVPLRVVVVVQWLSCFVGEVRNSS